MNRQLLNQLRAQLLLLPFGLLLERSATLVLSLLHVSKPCTSPASGMMPPTQMVVMLRAAVLEEDDLDLYTDVLPHRIHALSLG